MRTNEKCQLKEEGVKGGRMPLRASLRRSAKHAALGPDKEKYRIHLRVTPRLAFLLVALEVSLCAHIDQDTDLPGFD